MTADNIDAILLILVLISGLGLVGIIVWLLRMTTASRVSGRVGSFVGPVNTAVPAQTPKVEGSMIRLEQFEGIRGQLNEALTVLSTFKLQEKISSAYWPITDIEFILIRVAATLVGFLIGWAIPQNIIGGIGLGFLAYLVPGFLLDRAITQRRKKFSDQLLDFLILIKGAIGAGYSLPQALDMAVSQTNAPVSEEFSRVLREVKFGFALDQALTNLSERMQSDDLMLVVTAIIINTQVGGNLSVVLGVAIDTIRERIHLYGEVRSLTAYARYVGYFISLLPFIAALLIFFFNPRYFDNVGTELISQIIFVLAFIGLIIGNIIIRQIVKIKV